MYRQNKDQIFKFFSFAISITTLMVIISIVFFLFSNGMSFIRGQESLIDVFKLKENWFPMEGQYQFLPLIFASFILGVGATLVLVFVAMPFSLGQQFFIRGKLKRLVSLIITVANAIPSVVYGFWGITIVVPIVTKFHFLGTNLLSGIIVLSFMLLPTGVLLLSGVLNSLPKEVKQNCAALGMSKESQIINVYLPLLTREMPSVILLSFTRAIGETIAVVMVTGNIVSFPSSIFSPVRALTSNIALEMAYATGDHRNALIFSGILILALIFFLMLIFKGVEYVTTKKI